jgi:hypothetical protein
MIQNKDRLKTLLSSSELQYIRNVHEQQKGLKLTGTYQLPFCAHSINLPGKNVSTIQKNGGALLVTRRQAGLAVTAERTK